MSPNVRRIIFCIFTLIFIGVSVAVILFASGYRYNATRGVIEKTGQLVLDTDASHITVFLNGSAYAGRRDRASQLPFGKQALYIDTLMPGRYALRIIGEDSYPWEGTVIIYSGQSTVIRNITLISKKSSQTIPFRLGDELIGAREGSAFVYDTHTLYQTNDHEQKIITRLNENILSVYPSPSYQNFFVRTQGAAYCVGRDGKTNSIELPIDATLIRWGNDDVLYGAGKGGVYVISEGKVSHLYSKKVLDILSLGKEMLFLTVGNAGIDLLTTDSSGIKNIILSNQESLTSQARFLGAVNDTPLIADRDTVFALHIKADRGAMRSIEAFDNMISKGDVTLAWNQFEVRRLENDGEKVRSTLITRVSAPITGAWPINDHVSIIHFGDGELRVIDQSSTGEQNISIAQKITHFFYDEKNGTLFMIRRDGNNDVLEEYRVQAP